MNYIQTLNANLITENTEDNARRNLAVWNLYAPMMKIINDEIAERYDSWGPNSDEVIAWKNSKLDEITEWKKLAVNALVGCELKDCEVIVWRNKDDDDCEYSASFSRQMMVDYLDNISYDFQPQWDDIVWQGKLSDMPKDIEEDCPLIFSYDSYSNEWDEVITKGFYIDWETC